VAQRAIHPLITGAAGNILVTALFFAQAIALSPTYAWAHHSFAMFDADKQDTVEGAVKDFQWTNPHVWLDVVIVDPAGGDSKVWGMESQSPGILFRRGWKPDILKPGDKVMVVLHPMKDGHPGGQILKVTLPNGRVITTAMGEALK
jgi:hypothetical protein